MSGNFKNDIKTTGFIESKKVGKIAGALEELPTPSAEYEGFTIQLLGAVAETSPLRQYNTYMCQKQADGTYAWVDNSPAGGGKWGKIKGDLKDQDDLYPILQSKAEIKDTAESGSGFTWSIDKLNNQFAKVTGAVNVVVVDAKPELTDAKLKTIYYCGTSAPYHIWLCAYNSADPPVKSWYDMGTSEISLDNYYTKAETIAQVGIEKTRAEAAEATLTSSITAEKTARENAITTEAAARESADDTLSASIGAETTARTSADTVLQDNIDKKQNKVVYVTTLPDPSTLETGDLIIKDATDGYWSKVNPATIIDDTATSGEKTWSSNKIIAEAEDRYAKKGECPFPIGGVLTTKDVDFNPSTKWSGTTWEALPDLKEWDEVSETVIANPTGVTGVVAYSVHCNVVTVKFDAVRCAEPVKNYFYNIPSKYNPNANQLCVVLNAWDDNTTKTFACVNVGLAGNIYLRRISNTENTQYGFISYPCGGGTPDRTYKRYKRLT